MVAQLARPGGNITGLSALVTELQGKHVELIRGGAAHDLRQRSPQETMRATKALGLKARLVDLRRPDDLAAAIESAVKDGADALAVGMA